ncbi:alpha/beta fold hydrolase [Streptomyces pseudovenezuelae]|uniref:alpha/beta fold hydrolase n=1 Tax=Streptomyces pseudovenezuelae TaxID=67350 RepID=UPI0032AF94D9
MRPHPEPAEHLDEQPLPTPHLRPLRRDQLTRVTVPVLVVVGADDGYTPVSDAEAMHAALPDSTLRVIEGAAHLPNLERPGEFNETLGRFLARVG